jgi:hypothetical protein
MNTSGEEKRKPRIPSPEQIELLDDAMVEVLRRKTPAQRLAMAFEANRFARLRLEAHLHAMHPDWTPDQVMAEIARRMLLGSS